MAPSRRRGSRKAHTAAATRESSVLTSDSSALSEPPPEDSKDGKDTCPFCPEKPAASPADEKDVWIQCNGCKTWFHWRCVGEGGDYESLEKWYCPPCRTANPTLHPTIKPPARKSARKRAQPDYANLHAGLDVSAIDGSKWMRIIETKDIKPDSFKRMNGSDVTVEWLEQDPRAFKEPIVILKPDGLGMRMPEEGFTVADVAEIVGPLMPVEVIDVSTQSNTPNWTMEKWSEYYSLPPGSRDKIRNVISLEFSDTDLVNKVTPPRIVRDLDWVDKFWPANKKGDGLQWPKVQMYCLMSVANAWTDWHVDFAGSSVYYHIFRGSKIFYFIAPTPANLAAYERWSGTDLQGSTWLGDLVDDVVKVELVEGNTMIIPTGWIHAVHTPIDSLVFGGNFLHSWNVATQLRVREIEIATHVPKKFRFPLFIRLCWYVGEKYLRDLKAREEFPPRMLESLLALADFLVSEARIIEGRPGSASLSENARRESKEAPPPDKIKDAPALARELRWRIRNALEMGSGDEGWNGKRAKSTTKVMNGNGVKRKRGSVDVGEVENGRQLYRNWRRRPWDKEEMLDKKVETKVKRRRRPTVDEDLSGWLHNGADADDEMEQDNEGDLRESAEVAITTEVMIKVRRVKTADKGEVLERQRIERRLEVFSWHGEKQNVEVSENVPMPPLDKDENKAAVEEVGALDATGTAVVTPETRTVVEAQD